MTKPELIAFIDQHVSQIREHVDSVRIFVTADTEQGNSEFDSYDSGLGNYWAQVGQIKEWVIVQDELTRNDTSPAREADDDPTED